MLYAILCVLIVVWLQYNCACCCALHTVIVILSPILWGPVWGVGVVVRVRSVLIVGVRACGSYLICLDALWRSYGLPADSMELHQ